MVSPRQQKIKTSLEAILTILEDVTDVPSHILHEIRVPRTGEEIRSALIRAMNEGYDVLNLLNKKTYTSEGDWDPKVFGKTNHGKLIYAVCTKKKPYQFLRDPLTGEILTFDSKEEAAEEIRDPIRSLSRPACETCDDTGNISLGVSDEDVDMTEPCPSCRGNDSVSV